MNSPRVLIIPDEWRIEFPQTFDEKTFEETNNAVIVIWDDEPKIKASMIIDCHRIAKYFKGIQDNQPNIITFIKRSNFQPQMLELLGNNVDKIILIYTGHGRSSLNPGDDYPMFRGFKNSAILQSNIHTHLVSKKFKLVLSIFDCCNISMHKGFGDEPINKIKNSTLFDFIGSLKISACKPEEESRCDEFGSLFIRFFFSNFTDRIDETLERIKEPLKVNYKQTLIHAGKLMYDDPFTQTKNIEPKKRKTPPKGQTKLNFQKAEFDMDN